VAGVSVRFTAGEVEVELHLSVPQAVRLVEALARKTAEVVSAGGAGQGQSPATGAIGLPGWPGTHGG
jgi:hypothetical protein